MIRSMTGFGRAEQKSGSLLVAVEIRCVNHRFADLRVRVPRVLAPMEDGLRRHLASTVSRGRADATVSISGFRAEAPIEVNHDLIAAYLKTAAEVARRHSLPGEISLTAALSLPGAVAVRSVDEGAPSRREERAVRGAFESAVRALDKARKREGAHLAGDIAKRLKLIEKHRASIGKSAKGAPTRYAKRLEERLAGIEGNPRIDPGRLEQEVALLAAKADITEELVRLDGHVREAGLLIKGGKEPVGKRLEFLVQEMLREANTINSKSEELQVSRDALAIKAEIEKIREQVQNIE